MYYRDKKTIEDLVNKVIVANEVIDLVIRKERYKEVNKAIKYRNNIRDLLDNYCLERNLLSDYLVKLVDYYNER